MHNTQILYKDKYITITKYSLNIRKYYFPLATSKCVLFIDIQNISIKNALNVNHLWGPSTHFLNNWFNYDSTRKKKDIFIQIQLKNSRIKPFFTCEDSTLVFCILREYFGEMERKSVMFESNRNKETQIAQEQIHQRMREQKQLDGKMQENYEKTEQNLVVQEKMTELRSFQSKKTETQ